MSCLLDISSAVAGKLVEYTIEPLIRQVGYLVHYKSNLDNLRTEVDVQLLHSRERMQHRINEALNNGKAIEGDVLAWQKKVECITEEARLFFKDERHKKTKCFPGCCSSLVFRYKLSKLSKKTVEVVTDLIEKGNFSVIFYTVPPPVVSNMPPDDYIAFKSRISTLDNIMDVLRDPNNLIAVYGLRGMGKTTLIKEVVRQAENKKLFDAVAMVEKVNQTPESERIERIQKEIAENVGLSFPENQTIAGKARILCERIKNTNILIILDDVSERIDLQAVGLPIVPTCKVLLTSTRGPEVLSSKMRTQKEICLQALEEDENWTLFEKWAGNVVQDPTIRTVATQIAQKCGGLPALTETVAQILKCRTTLSAWRDAWNHLNILDQLDVKKKEYLVQILEWSYSTELDYESSSIREITRRNFSAHACEEQRFEEEISSTTVELFMFRAREVQIPNLTSLTIHKCNRLAFLLSPTMARSLVQLKRLVIIRCDLMKEIVLTEDLSEDTMGMMFRKLEHLQIEQLPKLVRFCSGQYVEFPSLEVLYIKSCFQMEAFISEGPLIKQSGTCNETEARGLKQTVDEYFLFDDKVGFPRVRKVFVHGFDKLTTIWHSQLVAPNSFSRVRALEVRNSKRLINIFQPHNIFMHELDSVNVEWNPVMKNIFPASVAISLQDELRVMLVKGCGAMEEIVSKGNDLEAVPQFVFSKVTQLWFRSLPKLKNFYPEVHSNSRWPVLQDFKVAGCDELKDELCYSIFSRVPDRVFTHKGWTDEGVVSSIVALNSQERERRERLKWCFQPRRKIWKRKNIFLVGLGSREETLEPIACCGQFGLF